MKKIISLVLTVFVMTLAVQAKDSSKGDFQSVIKKSGIDNNSISVSIKTDTGKEVYALNKNILMNPASVQKLFTIPIAVETLGEDYQFTTATYSRGADSYIIKLGADPFLSSKDLKKLVSPIPKEATKIYIDSSILDSKNWGEGWQWDDDMNTHMPRFGSYNLDRNIIKLTVMPAENGQYASIINPSKYPFVFYNTVTTSNINKLQISRDSELASNALTLKGTVAKAETVSIPCNNLKGYFDFQLNKALENRNVYIKEKFAVGYLKPDDIKATEITHELTPAVDEILKNSNNMFAETVFKLAGGKYKWLKGRYAGSGSAEDGVKMFEEYCAKHNLDKYGTKITDGSGVSKNNLVSADFVTEFMVINKNNPTLERLPHPGEGTLAKRMIPLKDSLRAKTGTLANISSIAGYLTSKNGNKYVFCIIINDTKLSDNEKKTLEDYIIREAYMRL